MHIEKKPVIVAAKRTACGKARKGSLRFLRPDSMMGAVIRDLMDQVPELSPEDVEDVVVGARFRRPHKG